MLPLKNIPLVLLFPSFVTRFGIRDLLGMAILANITLQTTELTRLQVGSDSGPANIIVSTIVEAENVLPLLLEYKNAGREINVNTTSLLSF